ncbi:catechol 1,2-dioxygenase [Salinisphaera orenii]|uniref:catechol 1,2-dioxygenase n=1 Tax=Salinisphaera orenii YIM 95161 TaxID=1051139 RepID=A0A423PDI2_9GAMM|nr:catechol 1,2-dioxygenase [Salinisphaera halophila]ROO22685.1 3'-RNA processing protein [Salinisphaera halophila YIM 95161]
MKHKSVHIAENPEVRDFAREISGLDSEAGDTRVKQIMHRLITDIFRLIDDLDVRPEEFWSAVSYLNELGGEKEAGLLAAGLGLEHYIDMRLDAEDAQAALQGGTPRTIEGPLYIPGAPKAEGFTRMDDGTDDGEVMWLHGQVRDADSGELIPGAVVDVWHADTQGNYSFFDASQSEYNLRRRIVTDGDGRYRARSIVPSGYGCPPEGATQRLLDQLGRHGHRPAHIHFFVSADGRQHLTTQINLADDAYLHDDFAYATRDELIAEVVRHDDADRAEALGIPTPFAEIEFNFELKSTADEHRQQPIKRPHAMEAI